jgi:hypothetical protein
VYERVSFSVVGSLKVAEQEPWASGMDMAMAEEPPVLWLKPGQVTPRVR